MSKADEGLEHAPRGVVHHAKPLLYGKRRKVRKLKFEFALFVVMVEL